MEELNQVESGDSKQEKKREKIAIARELMESKEKFPFSGIVERAYLKIKAEEEEYPGCATPIDTIIERCKNEGIKVVLGAHPESGNVYILPALSNDIENDSLFPKHLLSTNITNEKLKKLISIDGGLG